MAKNSILSTELQCKLDLLELFTYHTSYVGQLDGPWYMFRGKLGNSIILNDKDGVRYSAETELELVQKVLANLHKV